jgi:hypothetical protein
MKSSAYIMISLLATCLFAAGQDHYVSHWGSHTPPFNSWETAATNLSDALSIAASGATVWVTNGVYSGGTTNVGGLYARASVTHPLTLRSVNGYRKTVIEGAFHSDSPTIGANAVRALYVTDGVVDGFTLRRGATAASGSETATSGAGLYASGGVLRNMRIAGNHGYTAGGAWLQDCTVSNAVMAANISSTGPRVKINRNVRLHEVSLNADGPMLPDIRVLGTNSTVITNGAFATSIEQGTVFGQVHAVTGRLTHAFTVTNQGTRPLLVSSVTAQGGHNSDWSVASWPSNSIAPGGEATLEMAFEPRSPGARRALFFVACNDPDDDPYAIWLTGEGVQAEMLVLATNSYITITNGSSHPLLDLGTYFGDVRVTGDAKSSSYIVTNAGTTAMWIHQIATTELQAGDFSVSSPTGFPYSVAVGGTSPTTVAFAPLDLGYRATLLRFDSDAVNAPYLFAIMGRGVEPEMQVLGLGATLIPNGDSTPDAADGTYMGMYTGNPLTQVFTITNAGTHALTLTGTPHVVIGGAHAGDFSVASNPSGTIAPGGATAFSISFVPSVATTRTAQVYVYSDDVYFTNAVYQFSIEADCDPDLLFTDARASIASASASAVAWADIDNDGLLDLIMIGNDGTNRATRIYQNLGGGNFNLLSTTIPGVDAARLALGDIDNDGYVDIALSGMSASGPSAAIYRNNGDLTFTDINAGLPRVYTGGLAFGDFDNDGDLDLFVSGYTLSTSISALYRNNGDLTFTATADEFIPVRDASCVWLDDNKDGWLDLLITGTSDNGRVASLYRNTAGQFAALSTDGIAPVSHGGLATADFNADGNRDLLVTGYGDEGLFSDVYQYTGSASALFARQAREFTPVWLSTVLAADLNNNGWTDAVLAGEAAGNVRSTEFFFNSNGSLAKGLCPVPGVRTASIAAGDYDNDGDLDLLVSGLATNGSIGAIYRNLGTVSNTVPTAPAGLSAVLTNGNQVIFSWRAASDAETPTNALTYNLYVGDAMQPISVISPHADIDTGKRLIVALGNAGSRTNWFLRNLPPGETIHWGVQAIDSAFAGGPFATGTPFEIPAIPDYVVSDIQIQRLPFRATVTVANQGMDTGAAGKLSVWLDKPDTPSAGAASDAVASVGALAPGASTNLVFATFDFPTNTVQHVFRAYINSDHAQVESNVENNQRTLAYTYTVYPAFWFNAVALTDRVYLRWPDPVSIGAASALAHIRYATNTYPATISDGTGIYQGTNQVHVHTGLTPYQPYFYSIWLTNDGTNWFAPPE